MFKLLKHAVNLKNVNVLLGGGSMGKLFLKNMFFCIDDCMFIRHESNIR